MTEVRLEVSDASGRRVVRLDKESLTIGRSSGCDLRIFSVDVSRDHAQLVRSSWCVFRVSQIPR